MDERKDAWLAWIANGRPGDETRNELIEPYLEVFQGACIAAARRVNWNVDPAELLGPVFEGLVAAANRFDPAKGVKFRTFATSRVNGSIIDYLREIDPLSRTTRQKHKLLHAAEEALTQELQHTPSVEDLAERTGMKEREVTEHLRDREDSLDLELRICSDGRPAFLRDRIEEPDKQPTNQREAIRQATDALLDATEGWSFESRVVYYLRYVRGANQKQTGEAMGLSESRISQIENSNRQPRKPK